MKSIRSTMMIPLFGLFASLAACSGGAQPTEGTQTTGATSSSVAVEQAPAIDKLAHGPRMMHGPASLLFAALHEPIDLTDAQRTTLEETVKGLHEMGAPKAPPAPDAGQKAALVAAIRAGNIDTAKLAIKPAEAAFQPPDRAALEKALTTLHATLTKEQRVALVAAVQKHEGGPKGDKGSKHAGWNKEHGAKHGPMRMLEGLDLTKEQQDAIQAKLEAGKPAHVEKTEAERAAMKTQHEAMRKEMEARLQTFVGDEFDAKAFLTPPANAPARPGFEGKGDRMVNELAVIVPILTPAQREKLAQNLEKGPAAPPAPAAK